MFDRNHFPVRLNSAHDFVSDHHDAVFIAVRTPCMYPSDGMMIPLVPVTDPIRSQDGRSFVLMISSRWLRYPRTPSEISRFVRWKVT
jgi:hypothetical protein